jgi:hypothetical protein
LEIADNAGEGAIANALSFLQKKANGKKDLAAEAISVLSFSSILQGIFLIGKL